MLARGDAEPAMRPAFAAPRVRVGSSRGASLAKAEVSATRRAARRAEQDGQRLEHVDDLRWEPARSDDARHPMAAGSALCPRAEPRGSTRSKHAATQPTVWPTSRCARLPFDGALRREGGGAATLAFTAPPPAPRDAQVESLHVLHAQPPQQQQPQVLESLELLQPVCGGGSDHHTGADAPTHLLVLHPASPPLGPQHHQAAPDDVAGSLRLPAPPASILVPSLHPPGRHDPWARQQPAAPTAPLWLEHHHAEHQGASHAGGTPHQGQGQVPQGAGASPHAGHQLDAWQGQVQCAGGLGQLHALLQQAQHRQQQEQQHVTHAHVR